MRQDEAIEDVVQMEKGMERIPIPQGTLKVVLDMGRVHEGAPVGVPVFEQRVQRMQLWGSPDVERVRETVDVRECPNY